MKTKYFLVTVILATLIFGSASIVKASCMDENFSQRTYAEKIQCLTAIISDLQAQLQTILTQQGGQTWCHTFNTNLGFANSGSSEVSYLHTALQKENISYGSDDSNEFAEDTGAAVVQFQAKYGIRQTGYVGPLTRGKLNSLYGCGTTPPAIPNTPTVSFTANGSTDSTITVQTGSDTNFVYSSTNATSCYVYANSVLMNSTDIGLTQGATSGHWETLARTSGFTATYKVTCSNASGQQTSKSITLNSTAAVVPTVNLTANGSSGPTVSIQSGATVNLAWTSTNATSCYAYANSVLMNNVVVDGVPNNFQGQTSANIVVQPRNNITYSVTCSSSSGQSASSSITIQVSPLSVNSITVTSPSGGEQWMQGSTHTITWTGGNYSSGGYPGFDISLYPQPTSTCDINCVRSGVQRIATNFVTATGAYAWQVNNNITPGNYLVEVCAGGNGNLSAELACDDAGGINNNQYIAITAPITPTVNFTASDSNGQTFSTNTITVPVGSTINFAYSSTNAANCYGYINSSLMNSTPPDFNQGATSGNWQTLARISGITATYTITCTSASGTQTSKNITLNSTQ